MLVCLFLIIPLQSNFYIVLMMPPQRNTHAPCPFLQHSELSDHLEQRISALQLHTDLLPVSLGVQNKEVADEFVDRMRRKWRQFGLQLIERQISIQEEMELKGIIRNYEERIDQLLFGLSVKEQDLIYQQFEGRKMREYLPHRDSMNLLKIQWDNQEQIARFTAQVRKLSEEIKEIQQKLEERCDLVINTESKLDFDKIQAAKRRYAGASDDKKLIQTVKLIFYQKQKEVRLRKELQSLTTSINQSIKLHEVIRTNSTESPSPLKQQQPTKNSVDTACGSEDWELEQSVSRQSD